MGVGNSRGLTRAQKLLARATEQLAENTQKLAETQEALASAKSALNDSQVLTAKLSEQVINLGGSLE